MQRQFPPYEWDDRPLSAWLRPDVPADPQAYIAWRQARGTRFFFERLPDLPEPWSAVLDADRLLCGETPYFHGKRYDTGFPPNWHSSPIAAKQAAADRLHWTQVSDSVGGDIKFVWEPNRFSGVYTLVRAYAISHDEQYAQAYWQMIEDWAAQNPPQRGPNWKCGQEISIRLMAWCFGLYGFGASRHSTPERIAKLVAWIAAQAERVEKNIDYACSQKNNHALSEGAGLWTVGVLFPELAPAARWRKLGASIIEREAARQIYADGSYVQHSINYHRVMLHVLLWALRLGELNGQRFSDKLYQRVADATHFLYQLLDLDSGCAPNYGPNDGALILPLNGCPYTDYRPAVQAAHYLCHHTRLIGPGEWDEDLVWLFGEEALEAPTSHTVQTDLATPEGGYYTLRSPHSWMMARCAQYKDRPSQADQLHVDLWWRGVNIAGDAGTYLYNGAPPWDNRLSATCVHNTVTVDGLDQMTRISRFMWLDWASGRVTRQEQSGSLAYWAGEHDGYLRLDPAVRHRREVLRIGGETWLILDVLTSSGGHHYDLHWLLPVSPVDIDDRHIVVRTPAGDYHVCCGSDRAARFDTYQGDEATPRGWHSRHYGEKRPALSLSLVAEATCCRFWTLFSPLPCRVNLAVGTPHDILHIEAPAWHLDAAWDASLAHVNLSGSIKGQLL